jgi:NADPH2:quinone reductase
VLNYKTDDVAEGVRKFTGGKGVNVWYETQREPDLLRTVDLMAQRGRIVLIAGRQARPVFPVGPFYVKGLSMHGFAMFNATAEEQRTSAEQMNRWLAEGKLRPPIGKTFKLSEAAAAHKLLEENTLGGAGTLVGKVVLVP